MFVYYCISLMYLTESGHSAEAGDGDEAGAGYRGPAGLNSPSFLRSVNEGSGFIKERFFKRVLEQLQSSVEEWDSAKCPTVK